MVAIVGLLLFAILFWKLFGLVMSRSGGGAAVVFSGSVLSIIRVSGLWVGSALLSHTAGYGQVIGYWLLLFTLPEALVVRGLRNAPLLWKLSLSCLVIVGSFLLGAALAGFHGALHRRARMKVLGSLRREDIYEEHLRRKMHP